MSTRPGKFVPGSAAWIRAARARIAAGQEYCRNPLCTRGVSDLNPLTLDHILPRTHGGRGNKSNATILCKACNFEKGCGYWSWLPSLADEDREVAS